MTPILRAHGHAVRVRTPHGNGRYPITWRITTACGQHLTTPHVTLDSLSSLECPECARRLAALAPASKPTFELVPYVARPASERRAA